jgi:acyl-CoA thioester hydrolase
MTNEPPMSGDIPLSGRILDRAHLLPVRVYYEDTDFTGVVYHAGYLRFFERGRSEFLRCMGPAPGRGEDPGVFAVVRLEIDYRAPAKIHDALVVRTEYVGLKGPRLVFRQRALREDQLLAEAMVYAVALHPDGKVRRPSPGEITHWNSFGMETGM